MTVVVQIYIGYSYRLNVHLYRKIKLTPPPTCNCGLEDKQRNMYCRYAHFRQAAGQRVRPAVVHAAIIHTKLHDSKEELEKTATFILQTGLSV